MKHLPLNNPAFISAEKGFKEWLHILGYASIAVYNMPNAVREFLHWLEGRECICLADVTADIVAGYYDCLRRRSNARRGGGLSNAYLNKHQQF